MKAITVSLILFAAVNASAVFAACGGGGHTKPVVAAATTVETPIASMSSTREYQPTNVSVENRLPAAVPLPKLDTYTFDSMTTSGMLELSRSQSGSVDEVKADIRAQLDKVNAEYNRSFSALRACNGECRDQRKNLDRATAVMQAYRPNATFDNKLSKILTPEQMQQYVEALRKK